MFEPSSAKWRFLTNSDIFRQKPPVQDFTFRGQLMPITGAAWKLNSTILNIYNSATFHCQVSASAVLTMNALQRPTAGVFFDSKMDTDPGLGGACHPMSPINTALHYIMKLFYVYIYIIYIYILYCNIYKKKHALSREMERE